MIYFIDNSKTSTLQNFKTRKLQNWKTSKFPNFKTPKLLITLWIIKKTFKNLIFYYFSQKMSAISNIKGCHCAFESFISLLNVLCCGLVSWYVLSFRFLNLTNVKISSFWIPLKRKKMVALIYVSLQPEYRI